MRTVRLGLFLWAVLAASSCRTAPPPPPPPPPAAAAPALKAFDPARVLPPPLTVLPWALAFLLSGLVGMAIGENRGRRVAGFCFGLIAGPIGWALIAAGPDCRPRCRTCRFPVPASAVRCPHCSADLATK